MICHSTGKGKVRMKSPTRLTIITLLLAVSSLSAATHYVSLGSTNPQWPYATWATAATNIQHALDASNAGDTVLVTNGVYSVGWRIGGQGATRVVITNATALRSINGPQFTVINGVVGVRCVYLTDGASLSGFTLTNGSTPFRGGGVVGTSSNAFVTNCVISGNSADAGGGGAYSCTLYNCTLTGNLEGGGAVSCTLSNCTLSGNSANEGGGALNSTLYNCTLSGNDGGGALSSTLYNCTLTGNDGGGAFECTLNNCTLTGNEGSGAFECTLYNCTLTGNSGGGDPIAGGGGGASVSTLYNCTLSGNSAFDGGGAWYSKLYNCTLTSNSAEGYGGGASQCTLYRSEERRGGKECRSRWSSYH